MARDLCPLGPLEAPDHYPVSWFTFGYGQRHELNGYVFDKDVVVKIISEDPRKVMHDTFGPAWSQEYDHEPKMEYFPRGQILLTDVTNKLLEGCDRVIFV